MSATECTSSQQLFAGAYVLLGSLFTVSVLHEFTKLVHKHISLKTKTYKLLFIVSVIFILINIITLIKCIIYGLVHCNYIQLSDTFQTIVFEKLFQDLYAIQLYFLWIQLLLRLYYTFLGTTFALPKYFIKIYSIIMICLPILSLITISSQLYSIFIVISFSLSIFMTLSIIILYCFKLVQLNRHKQYQNSKQYKQYTNNNNGIDLLTTVTKQTILVLISTALSFITIFSLIFVFLFNSLENDQTHNVSRQQFLDFCLLLDCYMTSICILLQFNYIHSKYTSYCGGIHTWFIYYCNKMFINIQSAHIEPTNNMYPLGGKFNNKKRLISDSDFSTFHNNNIPPSPNVNSPLNGANMNDSPFVPQTRMAIRVTSSNDIESEFGTIPDIPENDTIYKSNEMISKPKTETLFKNVNVVKYVLIKQNGLNPNHTKRAIFVYEKYYGTDIYDISIIEEIIYRLNIKEKIKELKSVQNLYQTRSSVINILSELKLSDRYINLSLLLYEVMADMFEIGKHHKNIYDLELITEMIMRLRSKFDEYGYLIDNNNNYNDNNILFEEIDIENVSIEPESIEKHIQHESQKQIQIRNESLLSVPKKVNTIVSKPVIIDMISSVSIPSSSDGSNGDMGDIKNENINEIETETPTDEIEMVTTQIIHGEPDIHHENEATTSHTIHTSITGMTGINEDEPLQIDKTPQVSPVPNRNQTNHIVKRFPDVNMLSTIRDSTDAKMDSESSNNRKVNNNDNDVSEFEYESKGEIDLEDFYLNNNIFIGRDRLDTIRSVEQSTTFEGRLNSLRIEQKRNENKKINIEKEIVESERVYIAGLHILYDEFICVMFEKNLLSKKKYGKQIMCNIPEIIAFHEQFYNELKMGNIAKVFYEQSDWFKIYIQYIAEYNNILDIIAHNKKNKKLQEFLTHKRKDENKVFISHLILPIQRIPRYVLLLNELLAKTDKNMGFEYRDIESALKKVELVCNEINEKEREIENMSITLLILNKLKGVNVNIVEPQRKYIDRFIFKRKTDNKLHQFFLFNDSIIIADFKWKTQQIIKLMTFEVKKPSKFNQEILIKSLNDTITSYVSITNNINDIIHTIDNTFELNIENISDTQYFVDIIKKHRSLLYNNGKQQSQLSIGMSMVSLINHEEEDNNQLAQWQESKSKGNKNKVLSMLKSPSDYHD